MQGSLLRALGLLVAAGICATARADTAFTYQGSLTVAGSPANGAHDFEFGLWDAPTSGTRIGTAIFADDLAVSNGVFTVILDFGAGSFPGAGRWLEIGVRPGASSDAYTTLSPRRPITASPYAITADSATFADMAADSEKLDGQDPAMYLAGVNFGTGGSTLLDVDFQELASVTMKTPPGGYLVCLAAAGEIDFSATGVLLATFYLQVGSSPAIPITSFVSNTDEVLVMPLQPAVHPGPGGQFSVKLLAADNNGSGSVVVRRPSLFVMWLPTPPGEVGPGPW